MGPSWVWLASHGHVLWWSVLAVACAAGVAFGPRIVGAFAACVAHHRRGRVGEPREDLPGEDDVPVVLSGALECEGEAPPYAALSLHRGAQGEWVDCDAARGLSLVVGAKRVKIDGVIEVTHGSGLASVDRARLLLGEYADARCRVRAVHRGDRVRVAGVLRRDTEDLHAGGYRDGAAGRKLMPGAPGRILLAYEGASESALSPRSKRLASALALMGVWFVASLAVAAPVVGTADRWRGPIETLPTRAMCRGEGQHFLAIAAAVPVLRASALEKLAVSLACREERAADTGAALDSVHRALGTPCAERATVLEDLTDYERAAGAWARCDTPAAWQHAARLHFGLGRFREASQAIARAAVDSNDTASLSWAAYVHLLAGDLRRAADATGKLAQEAERASGSPEAALTLRCVEASLRARVGDAPSAPERLDVLTMQESNALLLRGPCALLREWMLHPSSRERTPDELGADLSSDSYSGPYEPGGVLREPERLALRAMSARRNVRASDAAAHGHSCHRWPLVLDHAVAGSALGDRSSAEGLLAALWSLPAGDIASCYRLDFPQQAFHAEVALALARADFTLCERTHGPRFGAHDEFVVDGYPRRANLACVGLGVLRRREHPPEAFWPLYRIPDLVRIKEPIERGDGGTLLRELRRWRPQDGETPRLSVYLAAMNRATAAAPLRAWLRHEDRWAGAKNHATVLVALADRLMAATALGDRAHADAIRAILARHRAALYDEDNAAALYVLRPSADQPVVTRASEDWSAVSFRLEDGGHPPISPSGDTQWRPFSVAEEVEGTQIQITNELE